MQSEMGSIRQFDEFRLDVESRVLWFGDELVALPLKAIELLMELTEQPGAIVSKDELMDRVWNESFVEESNLSNCIYLLRKNLGALNNREYIETVPRRGYRFVGAVANIIERHEIKIERKVFTQTVIEELIEDVGPLVPSVPRSDDPTITTRLGKRVGRLTLVGAALAVTVLILGAAYWSTTARQGGSAISSVRRIAILPLRARGIADDSVRLRLTDAIATKLSEGDRFTVRSSASMLGYDHSQRDPIAIGRHLDVDAIFDGSIQYEGSRLRVNLQMIDPKTGENLWSGQFDGQEDRLLALQDAISSKINTDLGLVSAQNSSPNTTRQLTDNSEAYEHYLRGRFFFYKRNAQDLKLASEHFERAIELDPNFLEAKLGLANIYAFRNDRREDCRRLVQEVLAVDPNSSQSFAILGFTKSFLDWNWTDGETDLLRAIDLDPSNSLARQWYANNLMVRSRYTEAEVQLKRALELDPPSVPIAADIGQLYYYQRRFEEAEDVLKKVLLMQGELANAKALLVSVQAASNNARRKITNNQKLTEVEVELINSRKDNLETIRKSNIRANQKAFDLAATATWYYASIGDRKRTLDGLNDQVAHRRFILPFDLQDPVFDFLRDDTDFKVILERMGLKP